MGGSLLNQPRVKVIPGTLANKLLEEAVELQLATCGMKSLEEIRRILRNHKDGIESGFKAQTIGVFGSYAKGEQRTDSDIDILVRLSDDATLFDLVGLAHYLEELLGIKVDLVSERALRSELRGIILEEVVAV